jgi:hypothetical protein
MTDQLLLVWYSSARCFGFTGGSEPATGRSVVQRRTTEAKAVLDSMREGVLSGYASLCTEIKPGNFGRNCSHICLHALTEHGFVEM